jgi:hypothetical protein
LLQMVGLSSYSLSVGINNLHALKPNRCQMNTYMDMGTCKPACMQMYMHAFMCYPSNRPMQIAHNVCTI